MTRGGDGLSGKLNIALSKVRDDLVDFLDDANSGWYDIPTKEDFVMRVRMALDDLDESELGWLFDEYVKDEEVDEDE